jgi:NADH-quinone oxidoreductase subunit K
MFSFETFFFQISLFLFLLGLWGLIAMRGTLISILIAIELLLFSCNMNFIAASFLLDDMLGQIFALFVLTVAAAESAIGLALVVVYYRVRGNISVDYVNLLKG